ncbi:hypothetical protein L9F63_003034, partial [Diploptera punctata]
PGRKLIKTVHRSQLTDVYISPIMKVCLRNVLLRNWLQTSVRLKDHKIFELACYFSDELLCFLNKLPQQNLKNKINENFMMANYIQTFCSLICSSETAITFNPQTLITKKTW